MLTFNNVEYSYLNQPVFSDLNFELNQGEFCFLIGKSGAGKSTLLQLIYMNILPTYGRISFDEYDSRTIKPRNLPMLRRKLGVIFQDFRLLKDRNIYENLSFVLEATNKSSGDIKRKVNDSLTDVGLSHRRYSMPNELSGGEKQRIAIARAIINDPVLILADEPTGNLDPETSLEILEILKKINTRGTAVIFATHNYELLKSYDAKIIRIEEGKAHKVIMKTKQ
ncbi:MAG TPA: ATP-binding cassette domain-containing protein [Ignavibacteriaceae bacterium]|nr:ATP-binding cassette domain-containing protein [Ignavibacteriaceae bacterium]